MRSRIQILGATLVVASGCHDGPTDSARRTAVDIPLAATPRAAATEASSTSSVRWNRRSVALFRVRGGDVGRINAYLSIAQYRAVLAAQAERHELGLIVRIELLVVERDATKATLTLLRETCLGAIDEYVAHCDRRQREKVGPITPGNPRLINELQVGFVN